jgi:hypothetical protein
MPKRTPPRRWTGAAADLQRQLLAGNAAEDSRQFRRNQRSDSRQRHWPQTGLTELVRAAKTVASSARASEREKETARNVLALARRNQPVVAPLAELVLWNAARCTQRALAKGWLVAPVFFPCPWCGVHVVLLYEREGRGGWQPEALLLAREGSA